MIKEKRTIAPPKLKDNLTKYEDAANDEASEIYDAEMLSLDFSKFSYDALDVNSSYIKDCKFIGSIFKLSNFTDVIFDCCDFSTCAFDNTSFLRCSFKNCKLTGATFTKNGFYDTGFYESVGELTAFIDCKIKSMEIKECNFSGLSFFNCLITALLLKDNKLNKLESINTFFKNVDFSTSIINGMRLNPETLAFSKISAVQAIMIAQLLKIEVI